MRIVDRASSSSTGSERPVVFIVDDDRATLELLSEVARDAGWTPRRFTQLAELRAAIDDEPPSLIVLDDDLPDGRGGDLAPELRNDPRLAGVPLLVCTAAHPMRQAQIGYWAPVVSKPFDLRVIERFLDDAWPQDRGSAAYAGRAG